ncbi:MAG: hypothetical protein L6Q66_00405 [Bacteroidia bacterium]|nr:hypothetical protein [Bacteroidia bacterium]
MNMTDVFNGIGNFFEWSFGIVEKLGNGPNIFFWLLIGSLIFVWLRMQARFNREAKEKGTLK